MRDECMRNLCARSQAVLLAPRGNTQSRSLRTRADRCRPRLAVLSQPGHLATALGSMRREQPREPRGAVLFSFRDITPRYDFSRYRVTISLASHNGIMSNSGPPRLTQPHGARSR